LGLAVIFLYEKGAETLIFISCKRFIFQKISVIALPRIIKSVADWCLFHSSFGAIFGAGYDSRSEALFATVPTFTA